MSSFSLAQNWSQWREKVDALQQRERALVLLTILAVIYMLWDFVIFNPVAVANSKVDNTVQTIEKNIFSMEQEERAILSALDADPDQDIKQQIEEASQRLVELDQSLEELSLGLVPVEMLADILRDVLAETKTLELQALRTLPVEAMSVFDEGEGVHPEENTGVYKHQVQLTLKGNYRELLAYLKALEKMDWRFYWGELRYEEDTYPDAVISLQVYTLSTDEGLFGV